MMYPPYNDRAGSEESGVQCVDKALVEPQNPIMAYEPEALNTDWPTAGFKC